MARGMVQSWPTSEVTPSKLVQSFICTFVAIETSLSRGIDD